MTPRARCALAVTDLDSTLIYPVRLATGRWTAPGCLVTVEVAGGRPVTVMPYDAATLWTALVAANSLIPATTRTTAQYTALTLPGRRPRIAITGNGADILYDGQPDLTWRRHVQHTLTAASAPFEQMAKALGALTDRSAAFDRTYGADELYFILGTRTPPFPDDLLAELAALTQSLGWRSVTHGRRIYVLPATLDKQNAVAHVAASYGADRVFAAGDATLDEQMLAAATAAIYPPHGTLHQRGWTAPQSTVATSTGLTASQEILEWFTVHMRDTRHDTADG